MGPPWYKHDCFDNSQNSSYRSSLESDYKINKTAVSDFSKLIIGVVKSTYVNYLKIHTEIVLETGKSETVNLKIKNNAGFLLGKLCIYNKKSKTIWPAEEPNYLFEIYKPPKPQIKLIQCPEPGCNANLNPKNLTRHLRRQHGHHKN